jgi:glycosyltransferase involved in cell wall biosynthesis
VVSEAQVSGIPALASNRGGLPESVGPGGLLLDPDGGLDRWTEALARMWDDEAEYARLAELAEQHARRPEFEPRAIAAALLSEFERLA